MLKKKPFSVRPLDSADHAAWDKLAERHGTVFDTIRWTGMFGSQLTRLGIYATSGELRGGFFVYETKKFGFRMLRNPPFTRQSGPFFETRKQNDAARNGEIRDVVDAMANYLSLNRAPIVSIGISEGIKDCLPFRWRKYKVVASYTYELPLNQTISFYDRFSKSRRSSISVGTRDGLDCRLVENVDDVRVLVGQTFQRQNLKIDEGVFEAILRRFCPGSNAFGFVTFDSDGPAAAAYVVYDDNKAYYLLGGVREHAHLSAGPLALSSSIEYAQNLGLKGFDFEGSSIPTIEHYFRSFGGDLKTIFRVNKAWFPIECAIKLMRREDF